jgi:hypothetical protein
MKSRAHGRNRRLQGGRTATSPGDGARGLDHHAGLLQQGVTKALSSQRIVKAWLFLEASHTNENMQKHGRKIGVVEVR